MQRAIYIVIFLAGLAHGLGFGQTTQQPLLITYSCNQKPLTDVISELQKNYGIKFSYSSTQINLETPVSVRVQQISLYDFLDTMLPRGVQYKVLHQQIILLPLAIEEQFFTISGYLRDSTSLEALIGATIYMPSEKIGTVTNAKGFFSIRTKGRQHILQFHCLGYRSDSVVVDVHADTLFMKRLSPLSYKMESVQIFHRNTDWHQDLRLMRLTNKTVDMELLKSAPSLLGEADVVRLLSIQPGVTTDEINSDNMNVRGGSSDQTQYMLDEIPLYDVTHFGSFFSVFNPDVVKNISIYKSDMPVWTGGVLSSVVDVRMREGNKDKWNFSGGIGTLSARATADGPIWKDRASLLVAYRRSYLDQLLALVNSNDEAQPIDFYFYDLNIKLDAAINARSTMTLNAYAGSDYFTQFSALFRQNALLGMEWNSAISKNIFLNTSFHYAYRYFSQDYSEGSGYNFLWESEHADMGAKTELSYFIIPQIELHFGYAYNWQIIHPSKTKPSSVSSAVIEKEVAPDYVGSHAAFGSFKFFPLQRLSFDAGMRISYNKQVGPKAISSYQTDSLGYSIGVTTGQFSKGDIIFDNWLPEPRLAVQYSPISKVFFRAVYQQTRQYLHQLIVYQPGITIKRPLPSSDRLPPELAHNYSIGVFSRPSKYLHVGVEGYYRRMFNLVESKLGPQAILSNDPANYTYKVTGKAYGVECFTKLFTRKLGAEFNYTLSRSERQTPELNQGNPFVTMYDHPHQINITAIYKLNQRMQVSALWTYRTGTPYTRPVAKYELDGKTMIHLDNGYVNNARLPDYHRLDISVDLAARRNPRRRWKGYWNFSVYNAYMHRNPLGITYLNTGAEGEKDEHVLQANYTYFYQFVPSVSYRFNF